MPCPLKSRIGTGFLAVVVIEAVEAGQNSRGRFKTCLYCYKNPCNPIIRLISDSDQITLFHTNTPPTTAINEMKAINPHSGKVGMVVKEIGSP